MSPGGKKRRTVALPAATSSTASSMPRWKWAHRDAAPRTTRSGVMKRKRMAQSALWSSITFTP